ncbi:ThiF family adenylyltransferase [Nonomuraea sp. KM90]|uniref:ThiF family adenylyltransferase n=1 Tax=Nonomuraea sp. KM90 TaxID=3457428 RepID=UPI003FCC5A91
MRPRVKPTLRHIVRDEHAMQYGVHPLRAVMLSGFTQPVLQWIEGLDGTRDLESVLRDAALAGLDEDRARSLLDQLTAQGALHDAAAGPGSLRDLPLAERDRLKPELDALDLGSTAPDGMIALFERRRASRVRVYGAGRVGAQVVALLAAAGVGNIRVIDPGKTRPADITPGGLTWAEVGMPREAAAVAVVRRLTSGGPASAEPDELDTAPAEPTAPDPTRGATGPGRRTGVTTPPGQAAPAAGRAGGVAGSAAGATGKRGAYDDHGSRRPREPVKGRDSRKAAGSPTQAVGPAVHPTERASDDTGESGRSCESFRPTVNALAGGPYLADRSDRPDLVILAPVTPLDGVLINDLNSLRIPHLLVSAFEGHGTVGPLVLPGTTACLHCLDLTRRDRDPDWPIVTARLGGYPPGEIACDVALATAVAAGAVGHALAHLDGRESAVTNGTIDVTPDWRWKRRSWRAHPQCRCMRNNPYSLRMVMAPNRD